MIPNPTRLHLMPASFMKGIACLLLFILQPIPLPAFQDSDYSLTFSDGNKTIENRLELSVTRKEHSELKKAEGEKINLGSREIVFNGLPIEAKDIHTRGQTSHYFRRKSYSLSLDKKTELIRDGESTPFKHLDALNLVMDYCYVNNRLAFALMERIGLSGLFYSYGEVRINRKSAGIYFFIERPQDWIYYSCRP